jgi:hypothetical protein
VSEMVIEIVVELKKASRSRMCVCDDSLRRGPKVLRIAAV